MHWSIFWSSCNHLGYEKYNTIRADPALCFVERVGRPDEKAIAAEQRGNDFMDGWAYYFSLEHEKHHVVLTLMFLLHIKIHLHEKNNLELNTYYV